MSKFDLANKHIDTPIKVRKDSWTVDGSHYDEAIRCRSITKVKMDECELFSLLSCRMG